MKLRGWVGMLLVGLLLCAGTARAGDHGSLCAGRWWPFTGPCSVRRMMKCWCPDDYCLKKLPPAPCGPSCWHPDDYCPKPLPPVPCRPPCGCADDYLPKCCPIQTGVGCGPNYTCGPCSDCNPPRWGCPRAR